MARKHARRRKRVSSPRRHKRRRVSGAVSVISGPRRRRSHSHKMSGPRRHRRRIGATGGNVGAFIGETLGVGVGLWGAQLATNAMQASTGPWGTAGTVFSAGIKGVGGYAIYSAGKDMSFVKGLGIGVAGSGINDGLALIPGVKISGVPQTIVIKDNSNKGILKMLPQQKQKQIAGLSVISSSDGNDYDDDQYLLTGTY